MLLARLSIALGLTACLATQVNANSGDLPSLGDSTSGYVSLQQEYTLGRIWLRQLRAQAPTLSDPMLTTFLENQIYRLVPYSGLNHPDLEFVVVDQPNLNAFAVPGGIIGINYGLLLYAQDEDEVSSVLAHELAHLSQRHYARRVEQAQRQEPVAIATLLASILLIATNNTNAGFAGLMAGQAATIQNQLAF
ncbi:MAG: peptidase M48, partial [Oceanospirillaceae bacterium]|nr:peptidase M48 [Oceanospirillaceae bacterium]